MALICLLRYGQLLEQNRHSWVNTTALITGCTNAAGLVVVGNFQVDHAKSLHYIGAGVAFPAGLLFVCLHCVLFYHGATTPLDMAMAYLRSVLAVIAFVTLVLSILLGQGSQELNPSTPVSTALVFHSLVLYLMYLFGMARQVLLGAHILLSLSLALLQVESSSSTRVLSYSMELPYVNGCLSWISSFSMAPSAMSLGQSPQTHW